MRGRDPEAIPESRLLIRVRDRSMPGFAQPLEVQPPQDGTQRVPMAILPETIRLQTVTH